MMGYNGGWGMGGGGASGFGLIAMIVILADLILLGVWLWQQVTKK